MTKAGHLFLAYLNARITMSHLSSRMSRPLFSNSWTSADVPKISRRLSWGLKDSQCCTKPTQTINFSSCSHVEQKLHVSIWKIHLVTDTVCHSQSHHQHLLQSAGQTSFMTGIQSDNSSIIARTQWVTGMNRQVALYLVTRSQCVKEHVDGDL